MHIVYAQRDMHACELSLSHGLVLFGGTQVSELA